MMRGQWNFTGQVVSDCGAIRFHGQKRLQRLRGSSVAGQEAYIPTHGLCNDVNYTAQCPACDSTCLARSMYSGGTDTACVVGDQISAVRDGSVPRRSWRRVRAVCCGSSCPSDSMPGGRPPVLTRARRRGRGGDGAQP